MYLIQKTINVNSTYRNLQNMTNETINAISERLNPTVSSVRVRSAMSNLS